MANEVVGSLKVLIGADTKALDSSLIAVNRKVSEFGTNMRNKGLMMSAAFTAPLLLIGKAGFDLASDLQEVQNVVDKSFRENSGVIDQWSKGLLDGFGLGELAAKKFAGTYKSMADGMDIADNKGVEMSKTLTELTGDMASFYNVRSDIADTALKSIFTGETESLKQFGIVMTEVNLDAFALAKGFKETYTEMDQAEKTTLRYEFVFDKMKNVMGDFALTSDSAANKMRLVEERAKQLGADIMGEAVPAIEDFLGVVDDLLKGFSGLDDEQKKTIITLGLIVAGIGPVTAGVGQLIKTSGELKTTIHVVGTAFDALKAKLATTTAAQTALNIAQAAMPFALVAAGIGLIVGSIYLYNNAVNAAADKVVDITEKTAEWNKSQKNVETNLNAEYSIVKDLIPQIEELASKENRTAKEQNLLNGYINRVNELMPGTIDKTKVLAGEYDNLAESAENAYKAMLKQVKIQARGDYLLELEKSIFDYNRQKADALIAYDEIAEKERNNGDGNSAYNYSNALLKFQKESKEKELDAIEKNLNEAEKLRADLETELKGILLDGTDGSGDGGNDGTATITEEDRVKAFEKARKNIEYLQIKEKWTTSKFYDELEKLRLQHLQNMTEDSVGYDLNRSTEVEVIKGREKPSGSGSGSKTEETPYQRDYRNTKYAYETGDLTDAEYYDEIEKLKLQYLKAGSAEAQQIDAEIYKGRKALADAAAAETERLLAESSDAEIKTYQEKLDNIKYLLDMQYITEAEFYDRLDQLRKTYLTSGSDLDRQAEVEIFQGRKALLAAQQKDLEDMVKESNTGLNDLNLSAAETSQKVKDKFNISANLGEFQSIIEGLASGEYSNSYSATKGYVNNSDYSSTGSSSLQAASIVININDGNYGIDAKEAAEDLAVELVDKLRNAGIIT